MIIRIVKLTFRDDTLQDFFSLWDTARHRVISMPGCRFVEMYHVKESPVCFTYSIWDSENDLDAYRDSETFKSTWKATKILFGDRPQAWTTHSKGFEGFICKGNKDAQGKIKDRI